MHVLLSVLLVVGSIAEIFFVFIKKKKFFFFLFKLICKLNEMGPRILANGFESNERSIVGIESVSH